MPKALGSRAKGMVLSLLQYFEQELQNGGPLLPLTAVRDRVAAALQVSVGTVNDIAAKFNKGELPESPKKKRKCLKPVVDIDRFDENAFRNIIYEMYKNKEHITLNSLKQTLVERGLFNGCTTSLWKIMKKIGFTYNKDDPRRCLMENPHVALKRVEFLKKYIRHKNEGVYQFVYLDETWIFKDGTIGRSWQDADKRSVKKTKVGGARYIVLHAGCTTGFIQGAELIFSSKTLNMDYHGEMNKENFMHWFEYQLLTNLEEPSMIVMDNASYHSTLVNKVPTTTSKKANIQEWLKINEVQYDETLLKTELLHLVQINKPQPAYLADTLAEQYGHKVLRLPPYHCIFNPIEHIWGITKNYYRDHVGSDGNSREQSLAMWKAALNQATPEVWARTIQNTEEEIQRWWNREVMFDREDVAPLIINFSDEDTSEVDDLSD